MPLRTINGIELYYEVTGQGPPILFIHGLGSSTRDWEAQVAPLADHYRVVTFDLRGHGQSHKPPGPYSVPLFASDTAALIESLELAPAHIVGISLGGMVALQLAVDRPQLLRSLVIVNSSPQVVLRTPRDHWHAWRRLLLVRLLGMRRSAQVLARRLFPGPDQADLRRLLVERWAKNDVDAYTASFRAFLGWSVEDRLPDITLPTLVIAADQDYTPVAAKEAYVARMPRADLVVIEDSRHATPADQPEQFNAALLAWLSQQT